MKYRKKLKSKVSNRFFLIILDELGGEGSFGVGIGNSYTRLRFPGIGMSSTRHVIVSQPKGRMFCYNILELVLLEALVTSKLKRGFSKLKRLHANMEVCNSNFIFPFSL
jgi:hypothetical protein